MTAGLVIDDTAHRERIEGGARRHSQDMLPRLRAYTLHGRDRALGAGETQQGKG